MAELNLKQITDKLNSEFTGEKRKLVFWYDEKADFIEDINSLELTGAKVLFLEKDNQFYTKYFLEKIDTETSYLIYAPFSKPHVRDNHLEDMILYSKQFFADRASLITKDLGMGEENKYVIEKYLKFFAAKDRTQKFYDLEIHNFSKETIETALMSVLCKTRTASFEEVVRVVIIEGNLEKNKYLEEFKKYDLISSFWSQCERNFGYTDGNPSLEKLLMTMFITYTEKYLKKGIPESWEKYSSYKAGNIIAFMDNVMNSILFREKYDELSEYIGKALDAEKHFEKYEVNDFSECDTFSFIDKIISEWLIERLLKEDCGVLINGRDIPAFCQYRKKTHFGEKYKAEFSAIENAFYVIKAARFSCGINSNEIIQDYIREDYKKDYFYRKFYLNYDKIESCIKFEKLRDLVEAIYTNEYLDKIISGWNKNFNPEVVIEKVNLQRRFYDNYIKTKKDKIVVIISDALRFETAKELEEKFLDDPKANIKMTAMIGVLPSITRLGMGALLPNEKLEITDEYKVLVNGKPCDDLKQREAILKGVTENSRCVQYDEIKSMKQEQLRNVFNGMEVVYVYHNQIDARGDKLNTENEVFNACDEAIEEIYSLVRRLSGTANTYHFIITADHGFIYKRDKLQESDKISGINIKGAMINRRFVLAKEALKDEGIINLELGKILGSDDRKILSYPSSSNVFKVSGGGQNFVHGGSSPQEMIIPLLDVKMDKGQMETRNARITLVSMVHKITNLITTLDFIQNEPISDVVKTATYKVFLISEKNERISNESVYIADKKDLEPQKRIFRLRFDLKNKQYDKSLNYYLVAYDEKNDMEILRHNVIIDIAFADDFGFNV